MRLFENLTQPPVRSADRTVTALCCWIFTAAALFIMPNKVLGLGPDKQIDQYGHDSWTSQRGLPGEAVYQILQSRDGYLWLRTSAGLVRFDGVRFVLMDAAIGDEPVKAICLNSESDLLIRTTSRTVLYSNGKFSDFLPPEPLPDGGVRVLFESRERQVLVGADDFVYLTRAHENHLLRKSTGWIHSMLEDSAGNVWIAGSNGIYRFFDGKLDVMSGASAYRSANAFTEDHEHGLWLGTNKGLYRMRLNGSSLELEPQKAFTAQVNAILEDRQGNLWLGNNAGGLTRFRHDRVSTFDATDGLTDGQVLALFEDREGSIWVGTSSGLDRFRDTKLTTITRKDGLCGDNTRSVLQTHDESLYVFCDGAGISLIRDGRISALTHGPAQPSGGNAMFEASDGALWIGADGLGLSRYKDGSFINFAGDGHLAKTFISAIAEDSESLILTDSDSETLRFKNGKVTPFTVRGQQTPLTAPGTYTFTIYRDTSGTLWFGTVRGLMKFSSGDNPGSAIQAGVTFPVTSISDDHHGSLWLGGRIPGLTRFHISDGKVTHYAKKDGMFDDYPSHALSDDDGNLWISTSNGIYMANGKDLDAFAEGHLDTVRTTAYRTFDGMKTSEASLPNSQPGGWRTSDGRLWFTTVKGVVVIDTHNLLHNNLAPPVRVEQVVTDGTDHLAQSRLEISPGMKSIEFLYTALSFRIPERVRFKYRLDGYDREWIDAGARRTAYYTNLPPGNYTFRVIAANDDGVWQDFGASVEVVLKPHYYQTRWFYVMCGLLVMGGSIIGNLRYTAMMRARARYLSDVVEERTAELRQSQHEMEQLAHYDPLTSLPNRRMFSKEFERMCSRGEGNNFSLILIDFDKFKAINDTYGHDAGDAFLVEAANRLESTIRSTDRIARLGGDEFAVLFPRAQDQDNVEIVCDRVLAAFRPQFMFNGVNIMTSASIGVANFPQHGATQEELFKSADLALYQAKKMGRNQKSVFRPDVSNDVLCTPQLAPIKA